MTFPPIPSATSANAQAELNTIATQSGIRVGGLDPISQLQLVTANLLTQAPPISGNAVYNVLDPIYGAKGDGIHDDSTAINNAIAAASAVGGGVVIVPYTAAGYNIGTAGVVLRANVDLIAVGGLVTLTYSGTGNAIDGWTHSFSFAEVRGFYVRCTNVAANGGRFGNGIQFIRVTNCQFQAASNASTGVGILFDGSTSSGSAFSGFCWLQNVQTLSFKYALKVTGTNAGSTTWTFIQGTNVSLVGPSNAAGSVAIWTDQYANCEGSQLWASIEAYAKKFQFDSPSSGMSVSGGFEANTDDGSLPTLPATFAGALEDFHSSWSYAAMANGATNRWSYESLASGVRKWAQRYSATWTYLSNGGTAYDHNVTRGDADGLNDEVIFGMHFAAVGSYSPTLNYFTVATKKVGIAGSTAFPVTDKSGAGLSFTDHGSFYVRTMDGTVKYFFALTFPATASSAFAQLSLPVVQAAVGGQIPGGYVTYNNSTIAITPLCTNTGGDDSFYLLNATTGAGVTNANMSGKEIRGVVEFFPQSLAG